MSKKKRIQIMTKKGNQGDITVSEDVGRETLSAPAEMVDAAHEEIKRKASEPKVWFVGCSRPEALAYVRDHRLEQGQWKHIIRIEQLHGRTISKNVQIVRGSELLTSRFNESDIEYWHSLLQLALHEGVDIHPDIFDEAKAYVEEFHRHRQRLHEIAKKHKKASYEKDLNLLTHQERDELLHGKWFPPEDRPPGDDDAI